MTAPTGIFARNNYVTTNFEVSVHELVEREETRGGGRTEIPEHSMLVQCPIPLH